MTIGSIASASVANSPPVSTAKAPAKPAAAPVPVAPVATDADGDHDGSVGSKLNVKA